jgi:hypothetical protein
MNTLKNPKWWNDEHESSWQRAKEALRRDWDQTKHDLGADEPNINQKAKNTVKQTTSNEAIPPRHQPVYEEVEPANRFGFGARSEYSEKYPEWNDELENRLKNDWTSVGGKKENWNKDRDAIRHGWDHEFDEDADLERAEKR